MDLGKLVLALDLYAEVLDALRGMAGRDGKVHARVFEHPLRIVRLGDRRLGAKERALELDRVVEVLDPDVNVQALHGVSFFQAQEGSQDGAATPVPQISGRPWQQSSTRKASNRRMPS